MGFNPHVLVSVIILASLSFVLPFHQSAYGQREQSNSYSEIKSTDKKSLDVGFSLSNKNPKPEDLTKFNIDFLKPNTKVLQEHIDYGLEIIREEKKVGEIQITHTSSGSVTIPYEFQESGKYNIIIKVEGILFQPIPTESVEFDVNVNGGVTSENGDTDSTTSNGGQQSEDNNVLEGNEGSGGGCLIATAAFGSELAPEVQFLREFRDNTIKSTMTGSSFINAFNSVYYSFSPQIADAEREYPLLKDTVKTMVSPLLAILKFTQPTFVKDSEISVLSSGVFASLLIGTVYFWPSGIMINKTNVYRKKTNPLTIACLLCMALFGISVAGILLSNPVITMTTISMLVVSCVVTAGVLFGFLLRKIGLWFKGTFL